MIIIMMKGMENWRVELVIGVQIILEVNAERVIFLEDSLPPLLSLKEMMPFDYVLRKCKEPTNLQSHRNYINPLMYMDDIKTFSKNPYAKKNLESRYNNGIRD